MYRNELEKLWNDLLTGKLKSYSDDEGVELEGSSTDIFAVIYDKQKRVDIVSLKDFSVVKSLTSGFVCNELPDAEFLISIDPEVEASTWNPNATPCWTHWETGLVSVDEILE